MPADDEIYITVIDRDGVRDMHQVSVRLNLTIADLINDNGYLNTPCKLPVAACSGCHLKVLTGLNKLPLLQDEEYGLVKCLKSADNQSRLACRIKIRESMNGMIVRLV